MPDLRSIFGDKPLSVCWTSHCKRGTIRLRFSKDISITAQSRTATGGSYVTTNNKSVVAERGKPVDEFASLPLVTTKVRIEVVPIDIVESKVTTTVPAAEAIKIFGCAPPTDETYDEIVRKVQERR